MKSSTFSAVSGLIGWAVRQDPPLIVDEALKENLEWVENTQIKYLTLVDHGAETVLAIRNIMLAGVDPLHPFWNEFRKGYIPEAQSAIARGDVAEAEKWERRHRSVMLEVADAIAKRATQEVHSNPDR